MKDLKLNKRWEAKMIDLVELNLDNQNYRIKKNEWENLIDNNTIINFLLENEDVEKIARSIQKNGYFQTETLIVCRENEKMIVLDGNRRLAACKSLTNPNIIKNPRIKKSFIEMAENFNLTNISQLEIKIAPSRDDALIEIGKNHLISHKKPWDSFQQAQSFKDKIDAGWNLTKISDAFGISKFRIKKTVARLNFFKLIDKELNRTQSNKIWKKGANLIERIILSKIGKRELDYKINDKGEIINKGKNFEKKLEFITDKFRNNKIKAQITKKDIEDLFNQNNQKLNLPRPNDKKQKENFKKEKKIPKRNDRNFLIPKDFNVEIAASRICDIYRELKQLLPLEGSSSVENAVAALFRVFFELSVKKFLKVYKECLYEYGKKSHKKRSIPLKNLVRKSIDKMEKENIMTEDELVEPKKLLLKNENNFLITTTFNTWMHNEHSFTSANELKTIWNNLENFLKKIWDTIKEKDKK